MSDDIVIPNLDIDEFRKYIDELNQESDRGAVLVSVAMIDDLLEKIILAFLIESKNTTELLSGFNAPLGTFSARILAAYSLGLISENEYAECNRLRKIRNEFAHNVYKRFNDQKMKDLCADLVFASTLLSQPTAIPKARFLSSATSLILLLTNRPHHISQRRLKFERWPY
jgi:mannitol operon repressor